jgi:hypothetical protein
MIEIVSACECCEAINNAGGWCVCEAMRKKHGKCFNCDKCIKHCLCGGFCRWKKKKPKAKK